MREHSSRSMRRKSRDGTLSGYPVEDNWDISNSEFVNECGAASEVDRVGPVPVRLASVAARMQLTLLSDDVGWLMVLGGCLVGAFA